MEATSVVSKTKKRSYHKTELVKSITFKVLMSIIILIVLFPFIWLLISSFKYEKDIIRKLQ